MWLLWPVIFNGTYFRIAEVTAWFQDNTGVFFGKRGG